MKSLNAEHRHWRALGRVVDIDNGAVWCLIPAWDGHAPVPIPHASFDSFQNKPFIGMRFHLQAKIGVNRSDDLECKDFEESLNQRVPTLEELNAKQSTAGPKES